MEEYKFIKSKGEKTMEQVKYIEMLQEHFKDAKEYFNPNTEIEMEKLGFSDSTWHQEFTPSYLLCDEESNIIIRIWFPNSLKVDDDMNFTKYSVTYTNDYKNIWEDEIFTNKELSEVLGFIKSNIELFNQLIKKEV